MEQSENNPRPIVDESTERTPMEVTMLTIDGTDWQLRRVENISSCLLQVMSATASSTALATAFMELKALEDHIKGNAEAEQAEKYDLKGIRNMLNLAQNEYEKAMKGMPRYGPSIALAAAVDTAVEYLGDFTEQAIHPLTPVAELIEASDRIDAEGDEDSPSIADELEAADLEGWNQ